jgi:replicative DNA helicase
MPPDDYFPEPPHHLESEQSIIGGLLLDNLAFDRISDKISELDFFTADNRKIFRAISEILSKRHPLDLVTLADHLESRKQLEDVGGIGFLADLVRNTPSAANIERYAEIVRDKSLMRSMAQISDEVRKRVLNPNGSSAKELLDFAQGKFMAIGENVAKSATSMQSIQLVLPRVADKIDEMFMREGDDDVVGLSTGLTDLDKLTTGLQPDDLFVLAGRPSMGKTALALNIARHVALSGKNVAIFSLEMSNDKLVYRFLSDLSGIHSQRLRTGRLYEADWAGLTTAMGKLSDVGIHMDDDASLTVGDIKARARRLFRSLPDGLQLIVIDYLQLIVTPGGSANRANEVAEVTRELKRLAKELQVPVLVLSQLNRSVESRPDKRPVMSDLRESGGIEQDADLIAFVYRDEYYNHDSEYKGTAEIIIAKQRNGPVDTVRTNFVSHLTRFENYVNMQPDDGSERYE